LPFDWKGRILVGNTQKWVHIRSIPEIVDDGDILWHGIIVDITIQIKAEEEINRKNLELSKLVAEKDKFFSIIAHDLRSPFNLLLGFTQMLDEELSFMEPEKIKEIVSILKNSAINVFGLLENLLEWSQIQRGMIAFNPVHFLLMPKITASLQTVMQSATKKEIEIRIDIPEDLELFADQNMFESIIRNLTSNSVKYTPKRGRITISARKTKDYNIEVFIKDSGIGMNSDLLNKLFRNDNLNTRKGTDGEVSHGLGLILCKEFVEKHGGKIQVESEVGKGSEFCIILPIRDVTENSR